MTSLKGDYPLPCDVCDSVDVRILSKQVPQDDGKIEVVCNECGETWFDYYEETLGYE
jgi:hypothetical protein